jgi:hypothetical protein
MNKAHVVAVALLLGIAAVFGLVAATKTARVGGAQAHASTASAVSIAARSRKLDQTERALRRALQDRPPALPAAPAVTPQRVVIERPAPVIVVKHRTGGEHEHEHEDAEGTGGDD